MSVTERDGGVRFSARVVPRASRSEIDGLYGTALKVRLAAPPVDGAANAALIALLAEAFSVPRRNIRIVSGQTSRTKVVEVAGITGAQVRARLDR